MAGSALLTGSSSRSAPRFSSAGRFGSAKPAAQFGVEPPATINPKPTDVVTDRFQSIFSAVPNASRGVTPPPAISAPNLVAPTPATFTPIAVPSGDLDAYERSLYEGAFNPVARELDSQKELALRGQTSQLANAGLAESGAGFGILNTTGKQFDDRRAAAAEDAAARAASARGEAEINIAAQNAQQKNAIDLANAQRAQDFALAKAGLTQQASIANAQNILTARTADADAYLKTLGINADLAKSYASSMLQALGIESQERIAGNQAQLTAASMLLDNELKNKSLALQAESQAETARNNAATIAFNADKATKDRQLQATLGLADLNKPVGAAAIIANPTGFGQATSGLAKIASGGRGGSGAPATTLGATAFSAPVPAQPYAGRFGF